VRARRLALLFAIVSLGAVGHAATREKAPPESVAQVDAALQSLATAFAGRPRKLASGAPGTIEHAIFEYAPLRYWPVEEGSLPSPSAGARCSGDMVDVAGRFCIDKYEASLVEKDGAAWTPYEPPAEGHVYVARSVPGVVPQAYISGAQAEAACRAAGKRLCAPVEWRAACGGRQGFTYPYGPKRVAGRCHDSGAAPMIVFHLQEMKRGWGPLELNDPRNNQLAGTVAKTGSFPSCVNDYGAYDMVGNLHEWTADPHGTFQGGYWLDTAQHGDGCAYRTIAHGYGYHDYSTGFRCCMDPEQVE
jgi:sulfatase modifying factor 1